MSSCHKNCSYIALVYQGDMKIPQSHQSGIKMRVLLLLFLIPFFTDLLEYSFTIWTCLHGDGGVLSFFFDWQGKEKLFIENNALPQRPRTPNSETRPSQPHSLVPLLGYSWSYCFFERPMGSVRSKLLVALFQMSGCSIFLLLYLWMQYYSGTTGKLLLNVVSCSWITIIIIIVIVIIGQH